MHKLILNLPANVYIKLSLIRVYRAPIIRLIMIIINSKDLFAGVYQFINSIPYLLFYAQHDVITRHAHKNANRNQLFFKPWRNIITCIVYIIVYLNYIRK